MIGHREQRAERFRSLRLAQPTQGIRPQGSPSHRRGEWRWPRNGPIFEEMIRMMRESGHGAEITV